MERPTGVTILAVLGFISAGLLVLAALGVLVGGAIIANLAARPQFGMLAGIGGAILGVFFLVLAGFYLAGGIGLWKLQNWARILVIVLCVLGALFNGLGVLTALFHFHVLVVVWRAILVAINVWIAVYLFQPNVKQAFGATGF
jgi:hypothetical protein